MLKCVFYNYEMKLNDKKSITAVISKMPKECKMWENRLYLCTKQMTMPRGLYSEKKHGEIKQNYFN